jgi:glycogen operon protein
LLSQGVPVIGHGDELGRTQDGSNNGYCQDSELTWIDWADADADLLEFTRAVSAVRTNHPVFRRRRFFDGKPVGRRGQGGLPDISWFTPGGAEMTDEDWGASFAKSLAVFLNGRGIPYLDARGQQVIDDSFLLCFNAHREPIEFILPPAEFGSCWRVVVYTGPKETILSQELPAAAKFTVDARTAVVLQAVEESAE